VNLIEKNKKNFLFIIKLLICFTFLFYLKDFFSLEFLQKIINNYKLIFIIIILSLIKIFLSVIKNYLQLKFLGKKINFNKSIIYLYKINLYSQLTTIAPFSNFVSKAYVDYEIFKNYNLSFKEYKNFNVLIIISYITFISMILTSYYYPIIAFFLISMLIFIFFIFKNKKKNLYFIYLIFNYMLVLSINLITNLIIIYNYSPEYLNQGNIIITIVANLIGIHINLIQFIPLNLGFSQFVYNKIFITFSLDPVVGIIISTTKQIAQIVFIFLIFIYFMKFSSKLKS